MQASELLELAAIVAVHGPAMVQSPLQAPQGAIENYWAASRCRMNRWARSLKRFSAEHASLAKAPRRRPSVLRGTLEEILASEVLTRVWTALMCAYDRRRGVDLAAPVARSVLLVHQEARHRMLTILASPEETATTKRLRLNRLRLQTERWTDLLVGCLGGVQEGDEFAFEPQRARDFALDLSDRVTEGPEGLVWPLLIAGLRGSFRRRLRRRCPNADLNREIAASILSFFPPGLLDRDGLFESLWMLRLGRNVEHAQGLIDRLLMPDSEETRFGHGTGHR